MKLKPIFAALLAVCACGTNPLDPGVDADLALIRRRTVSDLRYELSFDIPASRDSAIRASETIRYQLTEAVPFMGDFREPKIKILSFLIDGTEAGFAMMNEHIVSSRPLERGEHSVSIDFMAGEQSLNRRDEFLYTLLVPDRARTLFPCFDQPDLKASYTLTLTVPEDWCAVSNTYIESEELLEGGRKKVRFAATEPLSTYLFSFVAGRFDVVESERGGHRLRMYHRETDPKRIAQSGEVLRLVHESLDYMEEWTGIPYPFAKYDFVVIPDFQYGGMEHTGATLYNDRRIFLGENPTTDELLGRASLIAHETAHMWFGDYVTMRWFDDVWTKEVFANWFAAQMVRPAFPKVNHRLGDLKDYYASAYAEDRTAGSNAIQRPLQNLRDAGLIYCNIIYDKAPVVMDMLVQRMGLENFRGAVREYLSAYAYGNATWDDLVDILDRYADFDVKEWSRVWVKEPGMPVYDYETAGNSLILRQSDPFGSGNLWQQRVESLAMLADGSSVRVVSDREVSADTVNLSSEIVHLLPNVDGGAYGCFCLNGEDAAYARSVYPSRSETERMAILMNLYENVWRGRLDKAEFVEWCASQLQSEPNPLILGSMLGYATWAARFLPSAPQLESALLTMASDAALSGELRLLAFRQLYGTAVSEDTVGKLYSIWHDCDPLPGMTLGERDYTDMAYQLMLRLPARAEEICAMQRSRIENPDRLQTFDFVSRAVSADKAERDELFRLLLTPQGRRPESRALSALALLNHPLRGEEAIPYIRPALDIFPEVQRTGDIFLPASWCRALLSGHVSAEAAAEVQAYLEENPRLNPLLRTKLLQAAGHLER